MHLFFYKYKTSSKKEISNSTTVTFVTTLPQFIHVVSCKWWSCRLTWTYHIYSTTYSLPRR